VLNLPYEAGEARVKVLALETTGAYGSVAALEAGKLLLETNLQHDQRSVRTLAPGLRKLLAEVGWQPRDVELMAVAAGPGSFTGLRIGVTTAKTFAYAVGAEVLGINTLEVIASQAPPDVQALTVAMDAQRHELFVAPFERDRAGVFAAAGETRIVDMMTWLSQLAPGTVITGPVHALLAAQSSRFAVCSVPSAPDSGDETQSMPAYCEILPPQVTLLPPEYASPTAAAVGRLAFRDYSAGRRGDPFTLVPIYLRRSAAEEKAARQGQ
jgi:tRNA threonylcarbamoyladenosine biosynthesis protein TsaB